jgi:hypothetical protein
MRVFKLSGFRYYESPEAFWRASLYRDSLIRISEKAFMAALKAYNKKFW